MRIGLPVILLCLAGCGGRSSLLQPGDAGIHSLDGARVPSAERSVAALDARRGDSGCHVLLTVGQVSAPGCWIDEKVGNRTALLVWDCLSGEARAAFAVPFLGTVKAGQVALAATTLFPWSDGCTWRSYQRIEGQLSKGLLTYTYSEEPVQGTGCSSAHCKASVPVLVR